MCKCTPEIRTPFCGKQGCEIPKQRKYLGIWYPNGSEAMQMEWLYTDEEAFYFVQNHKEQLPMVLKPIKLTIQST